jgi:hypothetical protein
MQKPLLIGEAPSREGDRHYRFPLSGRPARVLCEVAGIAPLQGRNGDLATTRALYEQFKCLNLIERYEDATPWRAKPARAAAMRLHEKHLARRCDPGEAHRNQVVVVCLGRRVAGAMGLRPDHQWGAWLEAGLLQITVVPHPSGLSRIMNDPEIRALVGRVLNDAVARQKRSNDG